MATREKVLHIVYRRLPAGGWVASSPDMRRLRFEGASLQEVQDATRERLAEWLAPEVRIVEASDTSPR